MPLCLGLTGLLPSSAKHIEILAISYHWPIFRYLYVVVTSLCVAHKSMALWFVLYHAQASELFPFITYQNLGREATMSTGQADLNMLKVTVVEVGIVMVFVCLVIISLSL